MRVGIVSDIHGNIIALEKISSALKDCDMIISLGDVVNYGPWSNECVDMLSQERNIILIKGNHEDNFIKSTYNGTNEIAKSFFNFCIQGFSRHNQIKEYVEHYDNWNIRFTHTVDNQYIYSNSIIDIDRNYVIGHSHHQFRIDNNGFFLINSGSVGQNRKYINVINYMIFDTNNLTFDFKAIHYNVDLLINELFIRKYPQVCIDYYANKQRAH